MRRCLAQPWHPMTTAPEDRGETHSNAASPRHGGYQARSGEGSVVQSARGTHGATRPPPPPPRPGGGFFVTIPPCRTSATGRASFPKSSLGPVPNYNHGLDNCVVVTSTSLWRSTISGTTSTDCLVAISCTGGGVTCVARPARRLIRLLAQKKAKTHITKPMTEKTTEMAIRQTA